MNDDEGDPAEVDDPAESTSAEPDPALADPDEAAPDPDPAPEPEAVEPDPATADPEPASVAATPPPPAPAGGPPLAPVAADPPGPPQHTTIVGSPPPVLPPPPIPPAPQDTWSRSAPRGFEPRPLGGDRWNWAAGCVVGLAVLCLVYAAPAFATVVRHRQLNHQHLDAWLLFASGVVGILAVVGLVTQRITVVAVLSLLAAGLAAIHFVDLQDRWDLGSTQTWNTLSLVAGFVVLALCISLGLRRVD